MISLFNFSFSRDDSTLGDSWKREGLPQNPVLSDEGLRKIATQFDASVPQLVIKWCLEQAICIPRSRNPNHIETNFHLSHVHLNNQDRDYFKDLDGKIVVPDDGPPYDSRSKANIPDIEVGDQEKPVKDSTKSIADTIVLIDRVDLRDSTLYLSSDDHWIYAFDAVSGKMKWKYGTADEGGSKCAFNSDGTVVYCGTDDKSLRALDAVSGSLIWKFSTGGAITSSTRVGPDGSLYFGCLDGYFYAINPDGSLKWKQNLGEEIWSSPAVLSNGKTLFIGSMADGAANVFALNCATGEILWDNETKGPVFSSPTISYDGKTVFFCSFDANCYAFNTESGKELWVFQADSAIQSSPVVSKVDGTLFVGSSEGNIYAVDSATGKVKWTREGRVMMIKFTLNDFSPRSQKTDQVYTLKEKTVDRNVTSCARLNCHLALCHQFPYGCGFTPLRKLKLKTERLSKEKEILYFEKFSISRSTF